MEKEITGRHMHLWEDNRAYIDEKLDALAERFPRLVAAHVVADHEHNAGQIKIHVHGPEGNAEASTENDDLLVAFDEAYEKVLHQLRKKHDKLIDHNR